MKTRKFTFTMLVAACIYLVLGPIPPAFGVSPPPDGGYPGGNTAEGDNALLSLTTGLYNAAIGYAALQSNISGSFNTATGAGALLLNTGDDNTATGAGALLYNTTGAFNTANGAFALLSNTSGSRNTAVGDSALLINNTGGTNTAVGVSALRNNSGGMDNVAVGNDALGSNNANDNTAVGYQALFTNTTGYYNTAVGAGSLFSNNGTVNTAIGNGALNSNTTGGENTAMGFLALKSNTTGHSNTALGPRVLGANITGSWNVAIGQYAGSYITGDNNVCLGSTAHGAGGVSNTTWISNIADTALPNSVFVTVDSDGRLGYQSSSRRYKEEIKPIDTASEAIFALQPRSFHYNSDVDPARSLDYGFVAEEVAAVNADLAVRDNQGKIITVRYNAINAMLLNEFLKEHKNVEAQRVEIATQEARITELQRIVAQQQKAMEALSANARAQATRIERVTAEIHMSSGAAQLTLNKR